jgi:hypothetical protein
LSSTTNLRVGTLLVLDQLDDPTTDNGAIWVRQTVYFFNAYNCWAKSEYHTRYEAAASSPTDGGSASAGDTAIYARYRIRCISRGNQRGSS